MFEIVRAIRDALGIESTWAFVCLMAVVFAFLGGGTGWIVDTAYRNTLAREQQLVQRSDTASDVATLDQVRALLSPVQNNRYRDAVSEVIYALEPTARITVGGAVLGRDGARTVDIQVSSLGKGALRVTAIDVVDQPNGKPVDIDAIDNAESKRHDIHVDAMLVCSRTGFSPAAISKAKRTGVGLISALRQGDDRAAVIEEEIYLRKIKFITPSKVNYEGPKIQPGERRTTDPPMREHDLKYRGASLDAWLEARMLMGMGGIKINGPVTFYYRFKKPTNFSLPGGRQMRLTKVSISADVEIQWFSQVVQLDATNAIYDYVRGRIRLGSGANKYVIKGINWNTAIPAPEPPTANPLAFGLLPGEAEVWFMYVEGGPVGGKPSSEIDALIEPEDLKTDPQPIIGRRQR